ncbi:T9SS type A sorting domain-containing protein, partial [candidate division KSB1 bacterium]|nr:T9SS type A sorting domain-containing protein [candidate division KSB1 bacterium]
TAWPPAVDLSYSNAALMEAGTDGLPLGDLNWFPAKKAIYETNRDQYVLALQDSVRNAKAVYVPGSATPMWTPSNPRVLSVSGEIIIPTETTLYHNYPNPFNPETTIEFNLAKSGRTTLEVYNVMGQRVATLVNGQLNSGLHRFTFDATQFATGVYIYKLTSGNVTQVKKMMFLK